MLEKQTIVAGNINGVLEETLRAVGNEAQEVNDFLLTLTAIPTLPYSTESSSTYETLTVPYLIVGNLITLTEQTFDLPRIHALSKKRKDTQRHRL